MSILINLLPDVRQARAKERQRKQLATGISIAIWVFCGVLLLGMALFSAGQQVVINNTSNKISTEKSTLQNTSGLLDALTTENTLEALPTLYGNRVYMTKFFAAYTEADPTSVKLTSIGVDPSHLLTVSGTGTNYAAVAKLARALQASNLTVGTGAAASNTPYFTDVTLSGLSTAGVGGTISFTLKAQIAPEVTNASK